MNIKNLDASKPKNETDEILFSTIKNCATLVEQNRTKPQKNEFKLTQSRETFSFTPFMPSRPEEGPYLTQVNWLKILTSLEICNCNFL